VLSFRIGKTFPQNPFQLKPPGEAKQDKFKGVQEFEEEGVAGRDELPLVRVLSRSGFLNSYGPDERDLVPTG
jgi:hypothetical protein